MKRRLLCALLLCTSLTGQAQTAGTDSLRWDSPGAGNPFIPGYFADPTIRRFTVSDSKPDGKPRDVYFLYATTDGTGNGYGPAQVWVSYDFRNWKNIVMNWPTTEVVWAPDVVQQPDGTFRYYYCEPCVVSLGESRSPIGPWKNILGKEDAVLVPDRYVHNAITLDPQLFRDDDGQEYLYFTTWGIYKGFGCGVAKLSEKFTLHSSLNRSARFWNENHPFPIAADTFFSEKKLIPNEELKDIFEAPYVFKHNGIYYFTYSSGSCHDDTYRVQYATSSAGPMGPFEYKGCILKTNADGTVHGPGHHSILQEGDHYYIVYHRHNLPRSVHGFNRQICIDELKFDADGNILPVVPSHSGSKFYRPSGRTEITEETECTECGSKFFTLQRPRGGAAANSSLFTLHSSLPKNLAYQAKVTASSYYDEWFRPEYAVDDNNATLWRAAGTNWGQGNTTGKAEWLQIDLGSKQRFSEVWTQFEYATFFYQYKIETSLDGSSWTLFADRTANTQQGSPMIDKAQRTVKARYLRITITDTQKNGHMPAIWNVKVWQKAPELPYADSQAGSDLGYPGMHRKDVSTEERRHAHRAEIAIAVPDMARRLTAPTDISHITVPGGMHFEANKPLRMRVKDGRWALFFNGSQHLVSDAPLSRVYSYNAPYSITFWALQAEPAAVATIASLSATHADLATTEVRLGSDPRTGLISHNGSFESCGAPEAIAGAVGAWHHWTVTFDGWMERIYLDGQLLQEHNNFLMIRPEGRITIGADGAGTNHFRGYISMLGILPFAMTATDVATLYANTADATTPSLGDDDFDESDPDSRFTLSPSMHKVFEQAEVRLATDNGDFNSDPLHNGAIIYKEVKGDFVMMARMIDMEGLSTHSVKGYNEAGLIVTEEREVEGDDAAATYHQLGVFPLYNCGNMLTRLSPEGRPQFPNSKGYDFDPIMQFERRGHKLYARTSRDGLKWSNMPGSPIEVSTPTLRLGVYQTTYTPTASWAVLRDIVIYQ